MPTRARNRSIARQNTFIRAWREYRDLSQERLVSRLNERGIELSVAQYSRIENGVSPYTQDTLEAIAGALGTDVGGLLTRNPSEEDEIWPIWNRAETEKRRLILDIIKVVTKTGA